MVWELKSNQMPNTVQKLLLVVDKRTSGMNESLELLKCNENLPSSPGYASCDEHMELGKTFFTISKSSESLFVLCRGFPRDVSKHYIWNLNHTTYLVYINNSFSPETVAES